MSQSWTALLLIQPTNKRKFKISLMVILLMATLGLPSINVQAASTGTTTENEVEDTTLSAEAASAATNSTNTSPTNNNTLAAQLQPSESALSAANQKLLSQNAQLQRQVNDLQTQVNVLVYESRGQLFLYGAFTVIVSLLVGIFISWLVFVRRDRW